LRLQSLRLEQFRRYKALELDVSAANRHLFIGPNGSGKTNLLEAISVLSLSKSALGIDDEHVIQWKEAYYRVRGQCVTDAQDVTSIEIVSQLQPRKQKACFINDVRVGIADVIGELPTVLFLPQDLELFSGPPAERRRFIDQLLSQVSPEYFRALAEYQKYVKQRNALLKSIAQRQSLPTDLQPWDELLADRGSYIIVARLELMETFSLSLLNELQTLGETWPDVRMVYERATDSREQATMKEELLDGLVAVRDRDLAMQSTSIGPHRDDWYLSVDGRALATFASRGQQRASVLALLFLEASFIEVRKGEKPLILLDDVFSELDDVHQEGVLHAFSDHQVFITGTHPPKEMLDSQVWNVLNGEVSVDSFFV